MQKEIWKDVKNYEGIYKVSNLGNVKSLNYRCTGQEKLRKPVTDKDGYLIVGLCKGGKHKSYSVHRLVAQAFIPNNAPLFYDQVNHKDENPKNNRVDNLEWCDNIYNHNYGTRNARVAAANTNGKLSLPVLQFSLDGKLLSRYPSLREVERQTGFNHSNIGHCCNGKYQQAYGYKWFYS